MGFKHIYIILFRSLTSDNHTSNSLVKILQFKQSIDAIRFLFINMDN